MFHKKMLLTTVLARRHNHRLAKGVLYVLALFLTGLVVSDVTLILEDEFHYTVDCAMAVVVTLLLYPNLLWSIRASFLVYLPSNEVMLIL